MYGTINRENIHPKVNKEQLREEQKFFLRHRKLFEDIRRAYAKEQITKHDLMTLRGQIKAGDAQGAQKGLYRLLERGRID